MQRKRALGAAVSAVVMASAVLAGCGSGSGSADKNQQAAGNAAGGAPTKKGPIKLEMMLSTTSKLPEEDYIKKTFDQKFNTDIQLTVIPAVEEFNNRLNVRLASGDYPDIMVLSDRNQVQQYASKGLLLDLTPYKAKMQEISKFIGEDNVNAGMIGGKLFAISKKGGMPQSNYWIRKDWLDQLKLPVPTTTEELLAVAKAFTEQDPDGNGKKDTFGLTGSKLNTFLPLFGAFGVGLPTGQLDPVAKGSLYVKGGALVDSFHDAGMKEALTYVKKFLDAGVVDPDVFANTSNQHDKKAFQGKAGIIYTDFPRFTNEPQMKEWKDVNPKAEWIQLAPPKGQAQYAGAWDVSKPAFGMLAFPKVIEKDIDKLDKILEILNYTSTKEGSELVAFGEKGRHYNLEGNKFITTPLRAKEMFWPYQLTGRDEMQYLINVGYPEAEVKKSNETPRLKALNGYVILPDGYASTDAERYIEEELAKFIYGKRPIDEYDAFLKTLDTTFKYKVYLDSAAKQLGELGLVK
ncbi:extracellular solute-binding protein [Paenibacillus thalictri]|uniref:Extracellular solute-binding protein n=2 Tax=Paenibacillus thalictri TaxID=2527873 RepID=A0A4Q9DG68_9BACL|nr:extracellular solute-binding protein [Paenibacillus thalictri]